jgi:molecular chaperone IbpA
MISGRKEPTEETREFLHRGIAERAFERRFQLADYVVVANASLKNGMLKVELHRELPEAMKPRTIKIGSGGKAKRLSTAKKTN